MALPHFAGSGIGQVYVHQLQDFGTAMLLDPDRLHACFLRLPVNCLRQVELFLAYQIAASLPKQRCIVCATGKKSRGLKQARSPGNISNKDQPGMAGYGQGSVKKTLENKNPESCSVSLGR